MKIITIFLFFVYSSMHSQAPAMDWMLRYGGTQLNYGFSLIPTLDGGFMIGGHSNSNASGIKTENLVGFDYDYWVLKLNSVGAIEWQRDIGGGVTNPFIDSMGDRLSDIQQSSDGSYFLGGSSDSQIYGHKTEPCYGYYDYWVVKLDVSGNILWDKTLGGALGDGLTVLQPTPDGGCIAGGNSNSNVSGNKSENSRGGNDFWIVKLNASGQIEWQRTIGGSGNDILSSILETNSNEYLLGGWSDSNISGEKTENSKGSSDFWIVKINLSGTILWQKTIGGNSGDRLSSMTKSNNSILLAGDSSSNISGDKSENSRGLSDYWLVKIDNNGTLQWDKTYGGADSEDMFGVTPHPNGGYVVSGGTKSSSSGDKTDAFFGGTGDAWIIRIAENGSLLWQKAIGGSDGEALYNVITLSDQSIVLGGSTISPVSGNINVPGYGGLDYWLVKLQPETLGISYNETNQFSCYPNPTKEAVNLHFETQKEEISITVYNSLLQKTEEMVFNNSNSATFMLKGASGMYFVKVKTDNDRENLIKVIKK